MKKIFLVIGSFCSFFALQAQTDSLAYELIYAWNVSENGKIEYTALDTNLANFESIYVWPNTYLSAGQLGTLNSASFPRFFDLSYSLPCKLGYEKFYKPFFHSSANRNFYNTKRQFTELYYSAGGGKEEGEQRIGVLHTQNIDSISNVGIDYDHVSSLGRYLNQKTTGHFFSLFGSTERGQYKLYTHFDYNKVEQNENGGIDSLFYLQSNDYDKSINIPVKLTEGAVNTIKNYHFHMYQRVDLKRTFKVKAKEQQTAMNTDSLLNDSTEKPLSGIDTVNMSGEVTSSVAEGRGDSTRYKGLPVYIAHKLDFSNLYHSYKDDDISEAFYEDLAILIDSANTNDRQWYRTFSNRFSLGVQIKGFQLEGYYDVDMQRYKYTHYPDSTITATDTSVVDREQERYTDMRLGGYLRTQYKQFSIEGKAYYVLSGYNQNDYHIEGALKTPIPILRNVFFQGKFTQGLREASFMHYRYRSNHFSWDNSFDKVIYLQAKGELGNDLLNIGGNYTLLDNYVYLDETATPKQNKGGVSILQARVKTHLHFWKMHLRLQGGWQSTSNKAVMPLPDIAVYGRFNFEHLFKFPSTGGELLMEAGVNSAYFSSYESPAWMPVTAIFYNQQQISIGDYALWNAFLNFKLKRTRFFLNYTHFNQTMGKERYFSSPYYPEAPTTFKFGISWTFYN